VVPDRAKVRWQLPRWTTIALIVAVGLLASVVAGLLAARYSRSFNFDAASVVATAIATAALALFTAVLARATRVDANGTGQLVELTRRDQLLRDRGIAVVLRAEIVPSHCKAAIKNVGLGPVVYLTARVELRDESGTQLLTGVSSSDSALAPGEEFELDIELEPTSHLTKRTKVEGQLIYGTFLGRGPKPDHFLWKKNSQGQVSGLWGEEATPDRMARAVGRDDWAYLHSDQ
jgi:hypothetical protein